MITTATSCDKCGKVLINSSGVWSEDCVGFHVNIDDARKDSIRGDLCNRCYKKFEKVLKDLNLI